MEQPLVDTSNQQERLRDKAWLAGLWEGEGTFGIYTQKTKYGTRYYPIAQIVNSDFELIEEIHAVLDLNNIGHRILLRPLSQKNSNHKDIKVIWIYGMKRVKHLIDLILPEIRGKKRLVAKTVLEWIEYRLNTIQPRGKHGHLGTKNSLIDSQYREQVMALNKKGPVISSETTRQTAKAEDIVQAA